MLNQAIHYFWYACCSRINSSSGFWYSFNFFNNWISLVIFQTYFETYFYFQFFNKIIFYVTFVLRICQYIFSEVDDGISIEFSDLIWPFLILENTITYRICDCHISPTNLILLYQEFYQRILSLSAILDIFNFLYTHEVYRKLHLFLILIFEEFFGNLFNFNWASNLSESSNFLLLIIFF